MIISRYIRRKRNEPSTSRDSTYPCKSYQRLFFRDFREFYRNPQRQSSEQQSQFLSTYGNATISQHVSTSTSVYTQPYQLQHIGRENRALNLWYISNRVFTRIGTPHSVMLRIQTDAEPFHKIEAPISNSKIKCESLSLLLK